MDTTEQTIRDTLLEQDVTLPAGDWHVLGEGVWGTVYDLGDGTALKTVRRHGGLGTGQSKWHREVQLLKSLGGRTLAGGWEVPAFIGAGPLPVGASAVCPPMAGWILMGCLGEGRKAPAFGGLGGGHGGMQRQRLGEEIGAALAGFHQDTEPLSEELQALPDPLLRTLDEMMPRIGAPEDRDLIALLKERISHRRQQAPLVLCHGDLHTENLVRIDGERHALTDWAEAGMSFPEADLKHFESWPDLRDGVVFGYQIASGDKIDWDAYYLAATVNAFCTMTLRNGGNIRDQQRLRGMVDHCARQAGLTP